MADQRDGEELLDYEADFDLGEPDRDVGGDNPRTVPRAAEGQVPKALEERLQKLIKQQVVLAVANLLDDRETGGDQTTDRQVIHGQVTPSSRTAGRIEPPVASPQSTVSLAGASSRLDWRMIGEIIDKFNPDDRDSNVAAWIGRFDLLGDIHGWTGPERTQLMQSKLAGAAKRWFNSLADYNHSWDGWKTLLTNAFPRRVDYACQLEELVNRRKQAGESMSTYYHAKLALCEKCEITGERAVSCIIRGLPEELAPNAHAIKATNPQELYNKFLAGIDNYKTPSYRRPALDDGARLKIKRGLVTTMATGDVPSTRQGEAGEVKRRCYNCQEWSTHLSKDCPHPRVNRCKNCGSTTHLMADCPRRGDRTGSGGSGSRAGKAASTAPGTGGARKESGVRLVSDTLHDTFKKMGYVGGERRKVKVYVDTGSQHNIMTRCCADRLQLALVPCDRVLRGIGDVTLQPDGATTLDLEVDGLVFHIQALVVDASLSNADLLLGQPVLAAGDVTMVVRDGKACLLKRTDIGGLLEAITLEADGGARRRVKLAEDIEVAPGTTKRVAVTVEDQRDGETLQVNPLMFTHGRAVVTVPRAILNCRGEMTLDVGNLGEATLRWLKGRLIARADVIKADEQAVPQAVPQAIGEQAVPQAIGGEGDSNATTVSTIYIVSSENVAVGDVSEAEKAELLTLLNRWRECFSTGGRDLGLTTLGELEIKLTVDRPIYHNPYRLAYRERAVVREKIQELLDNGVVQESNSDFASPIVLVRKKNGEYRLCVDYRALNSVTVKDRYPLPRIEDHLDRLSGKVYYTSLDMTWGYHQVPVHPDSMSKTAFVTPDGHYEYRRVPFGLANAPAVFQRVVNKMLKGMQHDEVLAYMDDLLIPSATVASGLAALEKVLRLVSEAGVKLNLSKCSFLQTSIEYLGHEITAEGVRPGKGKTLAISAFPEPKDVHGVRQFVGLASYFRKFIKNFATMANPLTSLTKKGVDWRWGDVERGAFNQLKELLTGRPVLALYDGEAYTEVHTDASKLGLGGMLLQRQSSGEMKPVCYFSRTTTAAEKNYHSYELETLALVESIRRFRVYLVGVHFKAVTDCSSVRATFLKRDLIPRIARWWLAIQEYDMEVEYRPGTKMQHVDALSRNPIDVMLATITEADWFTTVQLQDEKARRIMELLANGSAHKDIRTNFKVHAGKLYRKTTDGDKLYVPAMAKFNLLRRHHDDIGHPGVERCYKLLQETYWFPRMRRFTEKYVKACLNCAFAKGDYGKRPGYLHPIEKAKVPFDTVHVDHLGPFVRSAKGNSYLLMVIDDFTKFVLAKPTRTLGTSETMMKLSEIFGEFGYPRRVISDRGRTFISSKLMGFLHDKGIRHVKNAVATPRANGQVERANRSIIDALATSAETEARWDEKLPDVIWGLNHMVNASTGVAPARLLFAKEDGPIAHLAGEFQGTHEDQVTRIKAARRKATENMAKTAKKMKMRFDNRRKDVKYTTGELVLWRQGAAGLGERGVSKKLANKYDGPYKIRRVFPKDRYEITSLQGVRGYKRFKAIVAVDALRHYSSTNAGDELGDQLASSGDEESVAGGTKHHSEGSGENPHEGVDSGMTSDKDTDVQADQSAGAGGDLDIDTDHDTSLTEAGVLTGGERTAEQVRVGHVPGAHTSDQGVVTRRTSDRGVVTRRTSDQGVVARQLPKRVVATPSRRYNTRSAGRLTGQTTARRKSFKGCDC